MTTENDTIEQAAEAIEQLLRDNEISYYRVKGKQYQMGSAVKVYLTDATPELTKQVTAVCQPYQCGTFDPKTGAYYMNNLDPDLPQVRFVLLRNYMTKNLRQEIEAFRLANFEAAELADDSVTENEAVMRLFLNVDSRYWDQKLYGVDSVLNNLFGDCEGDADAAE